MTNDWQFLSDLIINMNNNFTSDGNTKDDEPQATSSKKPTDAHTKMWASSDGLINSDNAQESKLENIELLEANTNERESQYPESLFFRDGQRKIDFVLVYESSGDEDDRKAAKRKIYEDNLRNKHGLELEEETSLQVLWFYYLRSVNLEKYIRLDS